MENLEDIIKRCQKNNSKAQRLLYDTFSPWLFGVCLQYCKDRTEAEDNLQEGFIKIYTNIKKYRFEGSFEGWMRRIVVNTIIESFRKKHPVYFVESLENIVKDEPADTENTVEVINPKELLSMIEELPPKYKLVFNLYAMEGLSHQEISEVLGISTGTSKSNLSRARKILKDKLAVKKNDSIIA
ncbi:RNA polymerase sigma factor [Plebeiibacterium marinum]|uniref:Sigma-70 family RNA polymerase sigma factor n=1 Tax=Plebeiibacterium marinum TaxID=2992111 RepID=A0AAE3SJT6_9BACT|nr:sigma-70 family RNA polymerase sigma factor [Plebeiobacterium marinum]MCW3805972.1 sigma-70 family RNA polymerase sigma factor [Plebeiobacterium marinum]